MTPAVVRLKCAVIDAVEGAGGKDGAAATAERQASVAGDWRNRNHKAFPPLDCAFRIDRAAVVAGRRPEMLLRYAAELGFVAIELPDLGGEGEAETAALMEAMQEFGDVAAALRDMLADGVREQHERDRVAHEIDEAQARLARLRAIVTQAERAAPAGDQSS